jgi:hypothetical protein
LLSGGDNDSRNDNGIGAAYAYVSLPVSVLGALSVLRAFSKPWSWGKFHPALQNARKKGDQMRNAIEHLGRRAYLVGYAVLLAVTVTMAVALAGSAPFADDPQSARAAKDQQSDTLRGQRDALRDTMLAQVTTKEPATSGAPDSGKKPNIVFIDRKSVV